MATWKTFLALSAANAGDKGLFESEKLARNVPKKESWKEVKIVEKERRMLVMALRALGLGKEVGELEVREFMEKGEAEKRDGEWIS